jgi:hypothetical protein
MNDPSVYMYQSRFSTLIAAMVVLSSVTQALAGTSCEPALTLEQVRLSDVRDQRRIWTGVLAVDASGCATTTGRFDINFMRLTKNGPDAPCAEHFMWRPGQLEVSVEFRADGAVLDYSIGDIAPCPCRE